MLIQVENLQEIVSSVPNSKRRFHIADDVMGIDPGRAIGAKTFTGTVLSGKEGQDFETESETKMVDVFYPCGITITTIVTDDLMARLFEQPSVIRCGASKVFSEEKDGETHLPRFDQPKKLTIGRGPIDSWN